MSLGADLLRIKWLQKKKKKIVPIFMGAGGSIGKQTVKLKREVKKSFLGLLMAVEIIKSKMAKFKT